MKAALYFMKVLAERSRNNTHSFWQSLPIRRCVMKMQMKTVLIGVLLLHIFVSTSFSQEKNVFLSPFDSCHVRAPQEIIIPFAREAASSPRVRLAYIIPSNRTPQPGGVAYLQSAVKIGQQWYKEQMEVNGFGAKTFVFETDADGVTPLVHVVHVSETDDFLRGDIWGRTIQAAANAGISVWSTGELWVLIPETHLMQPDGSVTGGVALGGGSGSGNGPGVAMIGSNALPFFRPGMITDDTPYDGQVLPAIGPYPMRQDFTFAWFEGNSFSSVASSSLGALWHEMGHAFGLAHDYRNDNNFHGNLMFNGLRGVRGSLFPEKYPSDYTRLEYASALILNVSHYFNRNKSVTSAPSLYYYNPSPVVPNQGLVRIPFEASDSDSLSLAQLRYAGDLVAEMTLEGTRYKSYFAIPYYAKGGTNTYTIALHDKQGNASYNNVRFDVPAGYNQASIPFIRIDPPVPGVNQSIILDASSSYDTDHDPSSLQVAWDTNNDGQFDTNLSADKRVQYRYETPGNYLIRMKITDPEGAQTISTPLSIKIPGTKDTDPPSVPSGLAASNITQTSFTLAWTASTDNVRVTGYEVFRNGISIATTAATSLLINTGLLPGTTYTLTVRTRDAAGNWSAKSTALKVTTAGKGSTGTGLMGVYFSNANLSGAPAVNRVDPQVNFTWDVASPATGIPADNFSVRWTGQVEAPVSGNYVFSTVSDDGVRLWINGILVINNWTEHAPVTNNSAAIGLTAGVKYDIRMEFFERTRGAIARLLWTYPGQSQQPVPQSNLFPAGLGNAGTGLRGDYFGNANLSGAPMVNRVDSQVNFTWDVASPATGIPADNFSVRWTGQVEAPVSGNYVFSTVSDDGVRLWINGIQVINNWTVHAPVTNNSSGINLIAGTKYDIRMEFFERTGGAIARLLWTYPGQVQQPVPQSRLYPVGASGTGTGLLGVYFSNANLSGTPVVNRVDSQVNFTWDITSPATGLPADNFSVRWTGQVEAPVSGNYVFSTVSDDGVRLWINGIQVISNWTQHAPLTNSSVAIGLTARVKYDIRMEFFEQTGGAIARLLWTYPGQSQQPVPQSRLYPVGANGIGTGLTGDYFSNVNLSGTPVVNRVDSQVNFTWDVASPATGISTDNFSVRWTGQVEAPVSGNYVFSTVTDDGVRLWINGILVINNWTVHAPVTNSAGINLIAGTKYDIRMEFFERTGGAIARLLWTYPGQSQQPVPQSRLYPVVSLEAGRVSFAVTEPSAEAIPTSDDLNPIRVYPNPAKTGLLNVIIYSYTKEDVEISIHSSLPQEIVAIRLSVSEGSNHIEIPVHNLMNGLHLLTINQGGRKTIRKIMIEK